MSDKPGAYDSQSNGSVSAPLSALDNRTLPPLGMTGSQFQEAASSVIDDIERYYANVSDRPVLSSVTPGYLRKLLPTSPPERGESWKDIELDIERAIMPGVTHWQSPKFMAFFPSSSTYPGILGEMWSAAITSPGFNWICSPAQTELETIVLDWLAQILGLPECFYSHGTGGGVIQGSASEAVATAVIAARERYIRRQIDREGIIDLEAIEDRECSLRSTLVALATDQTHSCTQKAAKIAGTRFRAIGTRRADEYALKGPDLRSKIEELLSKGLQPYFLTVSIGATSTCAVDDLASIFEVAKSYPDIWIHCDAAYAGAALVLPEYHHYSSVLGGCDSVDLNMHKWLLTNFDASCLFVRRRRDLTDALTVTPPYLRNQFSDGGLVTDYRDWQIPLGRRFRALKVWFVIRIWGVQGLREHIRHHLALGRLFADLVRSRPDLFHIVVPPAFALTVLTVNARRAAPAPWSATSATGPDPRPDQDTQVPVDVQTSDAELTAANELTREVYTLIDKRQEFYLTASVVGDVYAIRVVSANPLAEEKYIRQIFDTLVSTTEEVLGRQSPINSGSA